MTKKFTRDIIKEVLYWEGGLTEGQIDRENRVIRGVCILNSISLNNREYSDEALQDVAKLVEGKKSYLNHSKKGQPIRDVQEIAGRFSNVHVDNKSVRGDLHLLKSQSEFVMDVAETMPDVLGISIDGKGKVMKRKNQRDFVERVGLIRSGDLVTDPGTTKSLFESKKSEGDDMFELLKEFGIKVKEDADDAAILKAIEEVKLSEEDLGKLVEKALESDDPDTIKTILKYQSQRLVKTKEALETAESKAKEAKEAADKKAKEAKEQADKKKEEEKKAALALKKKEEEKKFGEGYTKVKDELDETKEALDATKGELDTAKKEIRELTNKVDAAEKKEKDEKDAAARATLVKEKLEASKLQEKHISETFNTLLLAAKDEAEIDNLIKDREETVFAESGKVKGHGAAKHQKKGTEQTKEEEETEYGEFLETIKG